MRPRGLRGAVARAVVEHEHLARERQELALARDRVEPAQQELPLGGVHDAVAQLDRAIHTPIVPCVRVHVVDPSAYTPPYDHALGRPIGLAGAEFEVELCTSRFAYGPVAVPEAYERRELFYRAARFAPGSRAQRAVKLAEHVPDMLA